MDIDTTKRIARVETALREDRRDAAACSAPRTCERCYALNSTAWCTRVGTQSS